MNKQRFLTSFLLVGIVFTGTAWVAHAQQNPPTVVTTTPPADTKPDVKPPAIESRPPLYFDKAETPLVARTFPKLAMEPLVQAAGAQDNPKDALALVHLWPNAKQADCASVEATLAAWSGILDRLEKPSPVILITIVEKENPIAKCIQDTAAKDALKNQAVFGSFASHFQTSDSNFRVQFGHMLGDQTATLVYDKLQTSWRGFVGPLALAKDAGTQEERDAATYRAGEVLAFTNSLLNAKKREPAHAAGYDMRAPGIATSAWSFARNLVGTVVHPRMCGFWGDFAKKNPAEVAVCKRWLAGRSAPGSVRALLLTDQRHDKTKGGVYASMGNLLTTDTLKRAKKTRRISFEFLPNLSSDGSALLLLIDSQNMIRYAQVIKADMSDASDSSVVLERLLATLPTKPKNLPFPAALTVPNQ